MIVIKSGRKMQIPLCEKDIVQYDNNFSNRVFIIPRVVEDKDISEYTFTLQLQPINKTEPPYFDTLTKVANETDISLTWNIKRHNTKDVGDLKVNLRVTDTNDNIFQSYIDTFRIVPSIGATQPSDVLTPNFVEQGIAEVTGLVEQATTQANTATQQAGNAQTAVNSIGSSVQEATEQANIAISKAKEANISQQKSLESEQNAKLSEINITEQLNDIMMYDYIANTQAKFDAMIASATWLDSVNVLIEGQFTADACIVIPRTVKKIHGTKGAKLTVTNSEDSSAKACLCYETQPVPYRVYEDMDMNVIYEYNSDYEIRNLTVERIDYAMYFYACFGNCINLHQCIAVCNPVNEINVGFNSCKNVVDCIVVGDGTYGIACADCETIVNFQSYVKGLSMLNCTDIRGCRATLYSSCSYCTNCRNDGVTYSGDLWSGITIKRDDDSCDLTVVQV